MEEQKKKRAAAYCRVSTKQDLQDGSFDMQCTYFQRKIQENPNLELAGIYGDHGKSRRAVKGRKELDRLLKDCKAGKIDVIYTKSISRFARNMGECIELIRQLKDWEVSIVFEKEKLDTGEQVNELILGILAAIAQEETGAKVAVYRFPNLMGHSRPNYNSAVSTFCNAVANDLPFTVNDRSTELELVYIDDVVEGMFDLLEGKEQHCEFDGVETVFDDHGRYCCIPVTHRATLGEIVNLLETFKQQPQTLLMLKMPEGSFAKKLYSLYLTYLPVEKFKYELKMNQDARGSFTELLHTEDCGQVSVNISRPGITKGQHWHNSKWELFIVVSGHGLIQERNITTGEVVEFEVSGEKIEAVHMIPGWTHNIIL